MTDRLTLVLKWLLVIVLAFYAGQVVLEFLNRIRPVIYILIAAIFLAYLIYPVVQRLRRRMPLVAAIALVYAAILVVIVVGGYFIVPRIMDDITMLVQRYPDLIARLNSIVYDPNDPLTARLPHWVRTELAAIPAELGAWVKLHGFESFGHIVVVLAGTFAAVAIFIIVPLVAAYLLLDLENLRRGLAAIVPKERLQTTFDVLAEIDGVIGGFIRGQLLVAFVVGVLITIALLLLHVRYAFLLGLLAAVGDLIPYVGAVLAFVPAFVTSLLNNGWVNALLVTGAIVIIYEVEGHLIAPNIVGSQVRLSPFIVLLALLIGAELGGIFGMLIAVPVAGVLRVVARRVLAHSRAN